MGRSMMQGTPWHYEYLHKKKKKRNSINCVFNNGQRCSCKISKNHGKQCVGENYCGDFERCSFSRPELYQNAKKSSQTSVPIRKDLPEKKKYDPKVTVEKGNRIVVSHISTNEKVDIHVTDEKNPFYLKQLNDIVLIKCEKYQIESIKKR